MVTTSHATGLEKALITGSGLQNGKGGGEEVFSLQKRGAKMF